jgi:hypothetical protein
MDKDTVAQMRFGSLKAFIFLSLLLLFHLISFVPSTYSFKKRQEQQQKRQVDKQ